MHHARLALELHSSRRSTSPTLADAVDDADRDSLAAAIEKARVAMESENTLELQRAVDELSGVAYQMTEKLYAALGGDEEEE